MWAEDIELASVKCSSLKLKFTQAGDQVRWMTALSRTCGGEAVEDGRCTSPKAMSLLLADPEDARKQLPRPEVWGETSPTLVTEAGL
ncbi:MAG: hypothetical protein ACYCOU_06855 [Sulfobacillus sp.]